jgi:dethiobiotin synthetase
MRSILITGTDTGIGKTRGAGIIRSGGHPCLP